MTQVDPENGKEKLSWPDTAAKLANIIAHYPIHNRKDLAELRRMNPEDPDTPAFWRLTNQHSLGMSPENERRWALILNGIALMTPNTNTEDQVRSAHNPRISIGKALFQGNDPERKDPICHERRVQQLLNSRGKAFRRNLAITMRMLAQNDVSLDWREIARLILYEGQDHESRQQAGLRITKDYYRAEYRANMPR